MNEKIRSEKLHPSLCSLCKDPLSCSQSDEYSGYEGAIQCLLDGAGQVAFTTIDAVDKFFRERASAVNLIENYQFLCLDGSRMPVTRRACEWSRRPSNTFIIRKGKGKKRIFPLFFLPFFSFFLFPSLKIFLFSLLLCMKKASSLKFHDLNIFGFLLSYTFSLCEKLTLFRFL